MNIKRFTAWLIAALLCLSPLSAFAEEYDISNGDITVSASGTGQTVTQVNGVTDHAETTPTVITGSSNTNTVTISAEAGAEAQVTFSGLEINAQSGHAAVTASGQGDVTIELDGNNMLTGGNEHAGLQKENEGTLTIQDQDNNGSLTANGGNYGAGIGGGDFGAGSEISITGGTVTATGGDDGAGLGGGNYGAGSDIPITGGTVTATGGSNGAGIGGGYDGDGQCIMISGAMVTASGGRQAAGIGGGVLGVGSGISIVGSDVIAVGGVTGAGIGSGGGEPYGTTDNISISGDSNVSVAGGSVLLLYPEGPGIGIPGRYGDESTEIEPDISNLSESGSISYYSAGTSADDIRNGTVKPYKIVPEKENGSRALVREKEEDAFTRFCRNVAKQIMEAPENGTVEVDATPWPGLQRRVFEALAKRPDVTLIVTASLNGEAAKLTIPAGLDLLSSIGKAKVIGFEDLGKLLG